MPAYKYDPRTSPSGDVTEISKADDGSGVLVHARHPFTMGDRHFIVEQVVCSLPAWDAYAESGSPLWSVALGGGLARAVRLIEDDGGAGGLHVFEPDRN